MYIYIISSTISCDVYPLFILQHCTFATQLQLICLSTIINIILQITIFLLFIPAFFKNRPQRYSQTCESSTARERYHISQSNSCWNHIFVIHPCVIPFPASSSTLSQVMSHKHLSLGNHHVFQRQHLTQFFFLIPPIVHELL